eukprot:813534-Rhodomonas_salina.1
MKRVACSSTLLFFCVFSTLKSYAAAIPITPQKLARENNVVEVESIDDLDIATTYTYIYREQETDKTVNGNMVNEESTNATQRVKLNISNQQSKNKTEKETLLIGTLLLSDQAKDFTRKTEDHDSIHPSISALISSFTTLQENIPPPLH